MTDSDPIEHSRRWTAIVRSVVLRGLLGMVRSLPIQLLSITSIAVSMLLLGVSVLVWGNTQSIIDQWGGDVPATVYLHDGVEPERIEGLHRRIARVPLVARVERVDPEQALDRLTAGLGTDGSAFRGLDAELFPTSFEIHWKTGAPSASRATLLDELRKSPEIEEVATTGEWSRRANALVDTLRDLAFGLGALVSLSCLAIVRATIRLGVLSRRGELEILGLVGGTRAFVGAPFMIEGLMQGVVGTGLAIAMLWGGFALVRPTLDAGLGLVLAGEGVRFFSAVQMVGGVCLGGLLGVLGSRAAVARYIEP